jgi:LPXTG-motif cell wall-anchored protein
MSTGAVKCWGSNLDGELGDGTTTNSNIPVDVIGLGAPAKAVTAGSGQTCVLLGTNEIRCFGANYYGGLGNGTEDSSSTPVRVIGLAPTTTTTTSTIPTTVAGTSGTTAPTLPATGSSSDSILAVAIAMLMIGSVIIARRRINS